ncbi:MAG TPA: alkyl sulfatase dimerization domain-containing protein [Polyangiales bacterium]|nr:alkyl sulfatase dimerization domain-containing protein [Polyangiales bacterium]
MTRHALLALAVILTLSACDERPSPLSGPEESKPGVAGNSAPSGYTESRNEAVAESLALGAQEDFADASRGLIASDPELRVTNAQGEVIWDMTSYGFIEGDAPSSVNPSLWRQERLHDIHGLFEVTEGVYQLRGFDLSNMTLIEGETGWIVVDPLTAEETARAAIAFARKHLGPRPVSAVIFTHSHVDHFGGVLGVVSAEEAARKKLPIIAPQFFMEEAMSENIVAGVAMGRRSMYMYGSRLPHGKRGHIGSGLGKEPAYGALGLLQPTQTITDTPTEMTVDGVKLVFQNAPGSEAPAAMTFYLPDRKAFCGADLLAHSMHNLYTLRGTQVRDALKWSGYIDEMLALFGEAEVYFGGHQWPIWGNTRVVDFLEKQRDLYRYIHDQTLRLALHGFTPKEIAEELTLPEALGNPFFNRGYYGTLEHNAKAVYQRYFGWYDGNPANLDPLPPAEAGARYVALAGGAASLLEKARAAYEQGEYRWVAELVNHLVFADPNDQDARELLAKAYDQLGYQAESAPWRDVYLTGAFELRHGGPDEGVDLASAMDMIKHAPVERFLDAMAVRLNGPRAEGEEMTINLVFTDLNESYVLEVENSVLHHDQRGPDPDANATLHITHDLYLRMLVGRAGLKETLFSEDLTVEGSRLDLLSFFRLFDRIDGTFDIVTP